MQRSQRLLAIIELMRDGALHRASDIAQRLGVSPRTIWRDMDALVATGVPIEGARGRGYRLRDALSLPPLQLTPGELDALNLGLAVVAQAADAPLRDAARRLSEKVDALLPERAIAAGEAWKTALSPHADATRALGHIPLIRTAIRARQKLRITYTEAGGTVTNQVIRPLQMEAWGKVWALTGWSETAEGFTVLRLDLMDSAEALPELFVDEPGKQIEDYAAGLSVRR